MNCTFYQLGKNGRLGNQLFQIASTIGIARKNNMNYIFPRWNYSHYFTNELPFSAEELKPDRHRGDEFKFEDVILEGRGQLWDLPGYWQSYKYFEKYWEDEIKKYFILKPEYENWIGQKYGEVLWYNTTCGVHFRRQDYLQHPSKHPVPPIEDYYLEAMISVQKRYPDVKFLISSDDIEWCKQNFKGSEFIFIENNADIIDLFVLSKCHHGIICNSTFSWWSNWIGKDGSGYKHNERIVITPHEDNWFGIDNKHLDVEFLLPKHWERIRY